MRISINANVARVIANQRNIVVVVRWDSRGAFDCTSRLFFGLSAGKKWGSHASKHPTASRLIPAAATVEPLPGKQGTERARRASYRMFAACSQGRLARKVQLSTLHPATLCFSLAG